MRESDAGPWSEPAPLRPALVPGLIRTFSSLRPFTSLDTLNSALGLQMVRRLLSTVVLRQGINRKGIGKIRSLRESRIDR
jgi:hypothetical protein